MIYFPSAKINLGLRITEKRPDGYHNLETVFYPIGLKDALEIVPTNDSSGYRLTCTGNLTEINQANNLVTKAYRFLSARVPLKPVNAYLHKVIPSGAGLGGGSSDAANMLKLLNESQKLGFSWEELEIMAGELGADCPFFIKNKPVYATGTGNIFEPVQVSLNGYYLVLLKPDVSISTADAYKHMIPQKTAIPLNELIKEPIHRWKECLKNDFEGYVFKKFPQVETVKQKLYAAGAIYASLTGSGSAVYGLFDRSVDLRNEFDDPFYWDEQL